MNSLMWYKKPASEWKEGLPIGNGVLAGMVMGGIERERVALNHEWLWKGQNRGRDIEPGPRHLEEIRRLFFEGKILEAGNLANEKLGGGGGVLEAGGRKNRVDPYQPAGDLFLSFGHTDVSGYRRELDLDRALASVSYAAGGKRFLREFFAHSAHRVIIVRVSAGGEAFDANAALSRIEDPDCRIEQRAEENSMGFTGEFSKGVKFAVSARLFAEKGTLNIPSRDKAKIEIRNCREALVLLTAAVSLNGEDPALQCEAQLDPVPAGWDGLLKTHLEEYRGCYRRVSLEVGESRDKVPTDERLAGLSSGREDNSLCELLFNYGRYLLISSSRGCGLPANLQGKWNEELRPPWECDLHHDINIQMNYWPAEPCNLSECALPFFEYVERFIPHGREAAKKLYNCEGILLPIQTDPWGRATPESRGYDVWTGAAAWLAQHFWQHYEYTLDRKFLEDRAYPLFKEVAAFYETYLVRDEYGFLVPVPSQSPENRFVGGNEPVSLCAGATMDLELIHDLLTHAIAASEILGADEEKRIKWRQILKEVPPLKIGKYGQLQEWLEDYDEVEPGHRHASHLFALFPGDQITVEETPELARAAEASLERRLAHNGGHTGWSRSWVVCFFARLRRGDDALRHIFELLKNYVTKTLLDLHPPVPPGIFQIDGNFGIAAGIAEMLLQSHKGLIRVLPALPFSWQKGKVAGLCARGGFEADIEWENGRPKKINIFSRSGGVCRLKFPSAANAEVSADNKALLKKENTSGISFETAAGSRYEITLR